MEITQISKTGKSRYTVLFTIEGQEQFMPLYFSEIRRYHMTAGAVLDDSLFDTICTEVLNKRVLERAQYLLDRKMYTTAQLRQKLSDGGYPQCVIDHATEKLTEYHFIDDENYVRSYIEFKSGRKSQRQMKSELKAKGIPQDILENVFSDTEDTDLAALDKLVEKRCKNADLNDPKERSKQIRYLMGKGFLMSDILKKLHVED